MNRSLAFILRLCAWSPFLAFCALTSVLPNGYGADNEGGEPVEENKLKAIVFVKIMEFMTWPENRLGGPKETFRVGFFGVEDSLFQTYSQILGDLKVQSHPIELVRLKNRDLIPANLHVLFLGENCEDKFSEFLNLASEQGVLLVSGIPQYRRYGVHLNLLREKNRIVFEMNLTRIRAAGLDASSHILKLAHLVEDP